MMRKIYLICFLVLMAISCKKEMMEPVSMPIRNEITFSVGEKGKSYSELTDVNEIGASGKPIKVACVYSSDMNAPKFNADFIKGDEGKISTGYYYPADGTVSIAAVYPSTAITYSYSTSTGSHATFSWNAAVAEKDVVSAQMMGISHRSSSLDLQFNHVLSGVTVACKGQDASATYRIRRVSLTGRRAGVYDIFDDEWDDAQGTEGTLVLLSTATNLSSTSFLDLGKGLFVPGSVSLNIQWECSKGDYSYEYNITRDLEIIQGQRTDIKVSLGSGIVDVEFGLGGMGVKPWEEDESNGLNVPHSNVFLPIYSSLPSKRLMASRDGSTLSASNNGFSKVIVYKVYPGETLTLDNGDRFFGTFPVSAFCSETSFLTTGETIRTFEKLDADRFKGEQVTVPVGMNWLLCTVDKAKANDDDSIQLVKGDDFPPRT